MKTITLPNSAIVNNENTINTETSLVILGPNGSGKTRFGIQLESMLDPKKVIRISAQKSLMIPERVSPIDKDMAKANLMFGAFNQNFEQSVVYKQGSRWGNNPFSFLLSDYDKLLVYLFSENYETAINYLERSRVSQEKVPTPKTLIDNTIEIWEQVIPHRKLHYKGGTIEASFNKETTSQNYNASNMSDGERVIFYLIAQSLSAPEDGVIIIDEPEIHLHKSIQRKLWNEIESHRKDCIFVYLTHDLEFASTRTGSVKICLKEFDGTMFHWFQVPINEEIPEEVYLEIIGSRRPILFIEGTSSSYDKHIYSLVYPNYTIKTVGSCEKVIQSTKSFNTLNNLHSLSCFGIVDRDYRPDEYVSSLQENNVYCPKVAEVENLFLVEEVLEAIAKQFGTPIEKVEEIKNWVIGEFDKLKEKYALEATSSYINYNLNSFNGSSKSIEELNESLNELVSQMSIRQYYQSKLQEAEELVNQKNYTFILRIFNHKGLVAQVGKFFDIKPSVYTSKVQTLIQSGTINLLEAIKEYLPKFS